MDRPQPRQDIRRRFRIQGLSKAYRMLDDNDLKSIIEAELESERLLWVSRPGVLPFMLRPSVSVFGFGVVWTAFIVNFIYRWHSGQNDVQGPGGLFGMQGLLSDLFFVPFILIGLAMLLSPIWYYLEAKRTVYGVTDKRILIVVNRRAREVKSYGPSDIGAIERKERGNGSGDITFARRQFRDSEGQHSQEIKFVGILDVRSVERLIRETFANKPDAT